MSILVTGSVAVDRIMVFPDRFANHILPDKIHILNVSFHVPSMQQFWGGCAGNIAYGLRLLGEDPLILAAVGGDFGPYAQWLDACGIRRDGIRVFDASYTAQCFITTDLDDNQITAFHPGAMERAQEARIDDVQSELSHAVVGPNDKAAMQAYAAGLRARGVPTVIDPGQQILAFDGPELLEFMDGAAVYVTNDYEWALTLDKTGLDEDAIAARVGAAVVTRGGEGSLLIQGGTRTEIPVVTAERVVDPTGCGDAYRAGLLHGMARGLPLETACRIGSVMGSFFVEQQGTQTAGCDREHVRARYQGAFGDSL